MSAMKSSLKGTTSPSRDRHVERKKKKAKTSGGRNLSSREAASEDLDDDDMERNPSEYPFPSFQPSAWDVQRKKEKALKEIEHMKQGTSPPVVNFKRPEITFKQPMWHSDNNIKHNYLPKLDLNRLRTPPEANHSQDDGHPPWLTSLKRVVDGCPAQGRPIKYEDRSIQQARLAVAAAKSAREMSLSVNEQLGVQSPRGSLRGSLTGSVRSPLTFRNVGGASTSRSRPQPDMFSQVEDVPMPNMLHAPKRALSMRKKPKPPTKPPTKTNKDVSARTTIVGQPQSKSEEYNQLLMTSQVRAQIKEQCITPDNAEDTPWTNRANQMKSGDSAVALDKSTRPTMPRTQSKVGKALSRRKSIIISLPKMGVRMFTVAVDERGQPILPAGPK